jgi:hypothetical protein
LTLDPGWKKFGCGIWDKHPGSATLFIMVISIPEPEILKFGIDQDPRIRSYELRIRILILVFFQMLSKIIKKYYFLS